MLAYLPSVFVFLKDGSFAIYLVASTAFVILPILFKKTSNQNLHLNVRAIIAMTQLLEYFEGQLSRFITCSHFSLLMVDQNFVTN